MLTTEELLTPKETAALLKWAEGTVYNKAYRGELPSVKIGRSLRFRRSSIEALIRQSERKAIR